MHKTSSYTDDNNSTFQEKKQQKKKQNIVFLSENHHCNSLSFPPLSAVQGDSQNSDCCSEDRQPTRITPHPCSGIKTTGPDLGLRNVFVCARVWVKTRHGLQQGVRGLLFEESFSQKPAWGGLEWGTPRRRHRRSRLRTLSASADTNPPPSPSDGRGAGGETAEWKTDTLMRSETRMRSRTHTRRSLESQCVCLGDCYPAWSVRSRRRSRRLRSPLTGSPLQPFRRTPPPSNSVPERWGGGSRRKKKKDESKRAWTIKERERKEEESHCYNKSWIHREPWFTSSSRRCWSCWWWTNMLKWNTSKGKESTSPNASMLINELHTQSIIIHRMPIWMRTSCKYWIQCFHSCILCSCKLIGQCWVLHYIFI